MTLSALGIFSAAGAGGGEVGTYELIQTQILGSSTSAITFSSLGDYASTYKHLQIRFTARSSRDTFADSIRLKINATDVTSGHNIRGVFDNGTPISDGGSGLNYITGAAAGGRLPSSAFGAGVIDILDSYSSTKNKTVRAFAGAPDEILALSSLLVSVGSTTSIELSLQVAPNFLTGSRYSIYGIRG
jgi:hypothetical protein